MVQRGERLSLAREALGEFRVAHALWREKFQRDKTVQGFLPGLVNHTHTAASETFKDFKLWKMRGNLFGRQRRLCGRGVVGESGFRFQVQRHEAIGAQPGGRILWKRRAALRTFRQ
jgi:hypothetical protein